MLASGHSAATIKPRGARLRSDKRGRDGGVRDELEAIIDMIARVRITDAGRRVLAEIQKN